MATLPRDLRDFRDQWGLGSLLTETNPKVLKSKGIAPTAVLHLHPSGVLCPAAGSCMAVCLNTAGNPLYLKGKIPCRKRRSGAFHADLKKFLRLLVIQYLRFAQRKLGEGAKLLGFRGNGTSDAPWEEYSLEITDADSAYLAALGITLKAGEYDNIFHALRSARIGNKRLSRYLKAYDYTKRIDRDMAKCGKYGYHLTFSHGSKFDTLSKAIQSGANYAAAFNLKRSQAFPDTVVINGQTLPVIDGDVTDFRPGDANGRTHVVGLRIKRTPGQTDAQREAFCVSI